MTRDYRTPRAVVVTPEGTWYGSGHHHAPGQGHADLLTDLPRLLAGAARLFGPDGTGVLIVDTTKSALLAAMGGDGAEVPGWKYTKVRPWTTFLGPDRIAIHIGLRPELPTEARRSPLFHPHDAPETIAHMLSRFHALTGHPWHGRGGLAGTTALRRIWDRPGAGQQPLWRYELPRHLHMIGPQIWTGRDTGWPDDAYVHLVDVNGMYLAALKNCPVAWGRLEKQTGPFDHDANEAGYFLINTFGLPPELFDTPERPGLLPRRMVDKDGCLLVTAPAMRYLMLAGHRPDIVSAWTTGNTEHIGRGYAERLIAVRTGQLGDVPTPVVAAVKRVYAELVAMVGRETGRIVRKDWQHHWTDLARVNMWRRLDKAEAAGFGRPIRINLDECAYLSTDPDHKGLLNALNGRPVGSRLPDPTGSGTFKHVRTLTVAEYRSTVLATVSK